MKPNFPTQPLRGVRQSMSAYLPTQLPRLRRIVEKSLALFVVIALLLGALPPAAYAAPMGQQAPTTGSCAAPPRGTAGKSNLFLPIVANAKSALTTFVGAAAPATRSPAAATVRSFNYQVGKLYTYIYDYTIETTSTGQNQQQDLRTATGTLTRINSYVDLTVLAKAADGTIDAQLALRAPFLCSTLDNGQQVVTEDAAFLAQLTTPIRFKQAANGAVLQVTSQPTVASAVTNLQKGVINFLQVTLRSDNNSYVAQETGGQGTYNAHYQLADTTAGLAITKTIGTGDFQQLITAGDPISSLQMNTQLNLLLDAQQQVLASVQVVEQHQSNDGSKMPANTNSTGADGLSVWSSVKTNGALTLQSVNDAPANVTVEAAAITALYVADSLGGTLEGDYANDKRIDLATIDLNQVLTDLEAATDKTPLFMYMLELQRADTATVVVDKLGQRLQQVINNQALANLYVDLLGAIGTPQAQAYLNGVFNNSTITAANLAASATITTQQQALINMASLAAPVTTTLQTLTQIGFDKNAPLSQVASTALGGLVDQFDEADPALESQIIAHYENDLHNVKSVTDALTCLKTLGNIGDPRSISEITPFLSQQITIDGQKITNPLDLWNLNVAAYGALRGIPGQAAEDLLIAGLQAETLPLDLRNVIAELLLDRQLDDESGLSANAAALLNSYVDTYLDAWDDDYDLAEGEPLQAASVQEVNGVLNRSWGKNFGNQYVGVRTPGSLTVATPPDSNFAGGNIYVQAMQKVDAYVWEVLPDANILTAMAHARYDGNNGYNIAVELRMMNDQLNLLNDSYFVSCNQEIGPLKLVDRHIAVFEKSVTIFVLGVIPVSFGVSAGAQLYLTLDAGATNVCGDGVRALRVRLTPGISITIVGEAYVNALLAQGGVALRGDLLKTTFPIQGQVQYLSNNSNRRWCLDVNIAVQPFGVRFYLFARARYNPFSDSWPVNKEWTVADWSTAAYTEPLLGICEGNLNTPPDAPSGGGFPADGKSDMAVFRSSDGTWTWRESGSGATRSQAWGQQGDIPVPGDYDGDGRPDAAIFRPSTGEWWLAQSRDGQKVVNFGQAGDIPIQADHDGDKRTDIAVWRPSNATAYWPNGGAYPWGQAGDIPVYADYDGDGKADSAIYRPSTNEWWISQTRDGHKTVLWGEAGDIPVARDYDGDGKADVAIWRPGDGNWWIIKSSNGAKQSTPWGVSGDTPAPADFDGDGKADPTVVRNENGQLTWWILDRSNGAKHNIPFGQSGDIPVP